MLQRYRNKRMTILLDYSEWKSSYLVEYKAEELATELFDAVVCQLNVSGLEYIPYDFRASDTIVGLKAALELEAFGPDFVISVYGERLYISEKDGDFTLVFEEPSQTGTQRIQFAAEELKELLSDTLFGLGETVNAELVSRNESVRFDIERKYAESVDHIRKQSRQ